MMFLRKCAAFIDKILTAIVRSILFIVAFVLSVIPGLEGLPILVSELYEGENKPRKPPEPRPQPLAHLVGEVGKTCSVLSPAGYVLVSGRRIPARNVWSLYVSSGRPVRVVEADGDTLLVEEVDEHGNCVRG